LKVEIKNASFAYTDSNYLFKNLNMKIQEKDIVSILGPNGTGKTTLIKCVLGLLKFNTGEVRADGSPVKKNDIFGYVPQTHSMNAPYTAFEMVLMGRARFISNFSSPGKNDLGIAREMMKKVGISNLGDRIFQTLSGGERQLVLTARALASECNMLIMDEPTSALDFKNQYKTLKMIKEVANEHGICILFTTHQPEHALYASGKTLLMGGEDFNFFGETTEVISEENLKKIYGLNTKIVEINHELGISKAVVPIME